MKMPRKIPASEKKNNGPMDTHYTEKRQKNNDAVKKSREKTRQKAKETMDKVSQLKQVNLLNNLNNFI
jgi:CCAAT/enhancer binding protein (C/EBP) gamma